MADIKTAIDYAKANPDSTFATELRTRIESGKMDKELIAAGLKEAPKPKGFIAAIKDIPSDIKEGFQGAVKDVQEGMDKAGEARAQVEENYFVTDPKTGKQVRKEGSISPLAGTVKTIGAGLGAGARVIGRGITTIGKFFISPSTEDKINKKVEDVAQKIASSDTVKSIVNGYNGLTPETKALVDGGLGITEGITSFLGLGAGSTAVKEGTAVATQAALDAVKAGAKTVEEVASAVKTATAPIVKSVAEKSAAVAGKVADVAGTAGEIAKAGAEGVSKIPGRVAVNAAEKKAAREAIDALPEGPVREAARQGIEIPDVNAVSKFAGSVPEQKKIAKELVDAVKKTATGDTTVDPREIVGKPIVNRIKALEQGRQKVGAKLGEVAQDLGTVTKKDLASPVYNSLRKVPGLKGLGIDKKGILDFDNTVLASSLSKADRKAIQSSFDEAIKGGTGQQKHLFRQELFEVLGGKKKSLTNMTDTQEKALDAIRSGLSTVLESKNPMYKKLSAQYRELITPLKDMRKLLKANDPNLEEDILSMKAGLLARRLTSNAGSGADVKNILKAMDEAIGKKSASAVKVQDIQELYNVLDKYYDIAPATGFQGGVKRGVEGATGFRAYFSKLIGDLAGETPAVRQKALEKILEEVLK